MYYCVVVFPAEDSTQLPLTTPLPVSEAGSEDALLAI